MKMKNDNENDNINPEKAEEFFNKFPKEYLTKIKMVADFLENELKTAKKYTKNEKELERSNLSDILDEPVDTISYEHSDYVLRINFGRVNAEINPDEFIEISKKLGNAFRFIDPTIPEYNPAKENDYYVGISSRKNFDLFYNQLLQYIHAHGIENQTEFKDNKIIFDNNECPIPPDTLENEFCKAMFRLGKVGQPVEWYDVSEFIEGEEHPKQESHQTQRPIAFERYHSAMRRVNEKAQTELGIDELFTYKKLYFTRNK